MKVNISIDDVSPHPESSDWVLKNTEKILKIFPFAKFTLFVPAAYWRTISHTTEEPLFLSSFPELCNRLKNLSPENYELGYHGFYHGIPGISNNDEFRDVDLVTAKKIIRSMKDEIEKAGLLFKPVLRPPAWRISEEAMLACWEEGISCLALHPDDLYLSFYKQGVKTYNGNITWCNINPPFKPFKDCKTAEIVYHSCTWDKNVLSDEATTNLIEWLKRQENLEFSFIDEISDNSSSRQVDSYNPKNF